MAPPTSSDAPEPSEEPLPPDGAEPTGDESLLDFLFYGLSLPERTVRSLSAVAGGLLHETAARLIPTAFRSSRSYALFVQQSLDMAVHDFGGVVTATPVNVEGTIEETQLARKAIGGMLDIASMSTLHLSPLTVLAAFSDIAYGSSFYLKQLSVELKKQGVIDPESSIDHVSDLLDALQKTGEQATGVLDQPPINIEGLRETIQHTRDSIADIDPTDVLPQSEIARMWSEMETAATAADVGLLDVSATMTMFAMNRLTLVSKGALSSVTVASNLLDQHVLSHYTDALREIREAGLYSTLSTASSPYLEAVWNNFDGERVTWTEDFLSGRMVERTLGSFRSWWAGETPAEPSPIPEPIPEPIRSKQPASQPEPPAPDPS